MENLRSICVSNFLIQKIYYRKGIGKKTFPNFNFTLYVFIAAVQEYHGDMAKCKRLRQLCARCQYAGSQRRTRLLSIAFCERFADDAAGTRIVLSLSLVAMRCEFLAGISLCDIVRRARNGRSQRSLRGDLNRWRMLLSSWRSYQECHGRRSVGETAFPRWKTLRYYFGFKIGENYLKLYDTFVAILNLKRPIQDPIRILWT